MKAYLVYRPPIDYGESAETFFVCVSKEGAEKRIENLKKKVNKLLGKIPLYTDQIQADKTQDLYDEWFMQKYNILNEENSFPVEFNHFDIFVDSKGFTKWMDGALKIMEIPFYK